MHRFFNRCNYDRMFKNRLKIKNNIMNNYFPAILLLISILTSCEYDKEDELYPTLACDTVNVTYSKNIEEIISNSCATSACHVAGTGRHIYNSYTDIKSDVDNGTVLDKVITKKTMPPGATLSECEYKLIDEWLKQGAKE